MKLDICILVALAIGLFIDVIRNHRKLRRLAEFDRNRGNYGRAE